MMLELTPDEAHLLREQLLRDLNAMHWEIANTDNDALRDELKRARALLDDIVSRLRAPVHA